MKVIIAGSRSITNYLLVRQAMRNAHAEGMRFTELGIDEIVSGGAAGVDTLGEKWATKNGIPIKRFIPDWDRFGKSAGYRRNCEMAEYSQALVALWDGRSKGTKHMISLAESKQMLVYVFRTDKL